MFNREVNYNILEAYIEMLLANDVTCVFVNGTTGEGLSMTIAERNKLTEKWISLGKNRFQAVIIHVGATNLKDMQEMARHAEEHGADAIATLPPLFYKPSNTDSLVKYLQQVASAAPHTPFFYYHNPFMVGNMAITLEGLVKTIFADNLIPTLCGVKYTSADLYEYGRCHAHVAKYCQFMYGMDEQLLPALTLGGEATIGSTWNYQGKTAARLIKAFEVGNIEEARKEQFRIQALVSVLKKYGECNLELTTGKSAMDMNMAKVAGGHPGVGKAIFSFVGPDLGPCRPPIYNLTKEEKEKLYKDLTDVDFFEWRK
ncbi:N-acetylneuraminate lyase B-like [Diadema antillarum]|uniref:N-acetylneuraminate lyase B-like n=1 Tax=Diadema antillarum TaxID=105358 RepID=UPI003A8C6B55